MKKYDIKINGNKYSVEVKNFDVTKAEVEVNGKTFAVEIDYPESETPVVIPKITKRAPVAQASAPAPVAQASAGNSINAPMPGLILQILVKVGDTVSVGQKVAVMEAMKMENDINSTVAGTVKEIKVGEGDNVQEKQAIIVLS